MGLRRAKQFKHGFAVTVLRSSIPISQVRAFDFDGRLFFAFTFPRHFLSSLVCHSISQVFLLSFEPFYVFDADQVQTEYVQSLSIYSEPEVVRLKIKIRF